MSHSVYAHFIHHIDQELTCYLFKLCYCYYYTIRIAFISDELFGILIMIIAEFNIYLPVGLTYTTAFVFLFVLHCNQRDVCREMLINFEYVRGTYDDSNRL